MTSASGQAVVAVAAGDLAAEHVAAGPPDRVGRADARAAARRPG